MKKIMQLLLVLISLSTSIITAQKEVNRTINKVQFKTDKIILNNKEAFNYVKIGNHFSILDLNNTEIISGDITSLGEGKFTSVITFIAENKTFSNSKIIGRDHIIFALLDNNVITKKFKIDPEKLDEFLTEFNELK